MRALPASAALLGVVLLLAGPGAGPSRGGGAAAPDAAWSLVPQDAGRGPLFPLSTPRAEPPVPRGGSAARPGLADAELTAVVQRTCVTCHNDAVLTGNLSLSGFDVARAYERAETAERMIRKLRAEMMPPPQAPYRPGGDTLLVLVETLERIVDRTAERSPTPGDRPFQRLNRAEYEASVKDLLGLEIDAGDYLPLDTRSANFDNIADVQMPSPAVLDAYLTAAAEISRLAVGYRSVGATSATYGVPRLASQWERVEGAPRGTRGGVSALHTFPADGEYVFRVEFHATPTGELFGRTAPFDERIEVSIDGVRVALLEIDRWMTDADPDGLNLRTDPIQVRAGTRRVAAAFLRTYEGPVNDILGPLGHSIADTQIGMEHGITNETHLRELEITGPFNPTGISETPSRQRVFTCRPLSPAESAPCARSILERLATQAYRRPATAEDVAALMAFWEEGASRGGFEAGIRLGLQAILASPHFVFRIEEVPARARPGQPFRLTDLDLASRLSFFLWGAPPDAELLDLARKGRLSNDRVLREQALRMLADPRSEALASRFAAQWLRLQDLEKVQPDVLDYPSFDAQLAAAFVRETQLFFMNVVREDRSVLELLGADYTFVNERLARHYGIPGVRGEQFRKVAYPDDRRGGLLGHGSVLTLTSVANRTSPVLRGKWVMEVLLGTPPPPPPPGVPDLEATEGASGGRLLTTRERMELHRANPMCESCHRFMDPIGLALDNFDVIGRWRIRENGMPLDTRGTYYDGSLVETPADLRTALLARPVPLVRSFTENLMAYALGRRVEYRDMPTVREIERKAAGSDYRMSTFILGVVESDAFRMRAMTTTANESAGGS